jgi:hypothetical protein
MYLQGQSQLRDTGWGNKIIYYYISLIASSYIKTQKIDFNFFFKLTKNAIFYAHVRAHVSSEWAHTRVKIHFFQIKYKIEKALGRAILDKNCAVNTPLVQQLGNAIFLGFFAIFCIHPTRYIKFKEFDIRLWVLYPLVHQVVKNVFFGHFCPFCTRTSFRPLVQQVGARVRVK